MTWLFTQVWLWSLAAFLLGSLITWLLFVVPLQRKLSALLVEHADESREYVRQDKDSYQPSTTGLELFDSEPQRAFPTHATPNEAQGAWVPASPEAFVAGPEDDSGVARTRSELAELPLTPLVTGPPISARKESAEEPVTAPPGDEASGEIQPSPGNVWFEKPELADELVASPRSPESRSGSSDELWTAVATDSDPATKLSAPPSTPVVSRDIRAVTGEQSPRLSGDGYLIKGHFASRQYHTPDSPQYDRIVAEVWFRTVEDAEQAGFEPWNGRAPRP